MQKMSYFFPLLCVGLDMGVVRAIRQAQLSPLLLHHPFITLWGGALTRALVLVFLAFTYPGGVPWARSFEGLQSVGVLCFHFPVFTTLLWWLGQSTVGELWGWHSLERVLQGYAVTAVGWLYWSRYVSSFVTSAPSKKKAEKPGPDSRAALKRLMGYMLPYTRRFIVVLALVVLSSYGEMAIPQYTGRMADWIINEEAPDAFSQAITIMTLLTFASAVFEFLCDLTYNVTMSLIHTSVQGAVFQAVLRQEIAFFDASPTGELVSRITTDTNDMSEALSEKLSLLMWYTARFGFLLFFMVSQSWKMTLLTCMGLPIIWVIPELTGHFHQTIAVKVQDSLAKANQVATETFSNMKTVRSFANEDGETEKYRRRLDETYSLNKQEAVAYAASTWANSMTTLALKVCILYYGGTLVTRGAVSSGDLVSFVLYELQFASAVEAVMRYYPEVKKAIGASEKIFEYLDRKPQIPPPGSLAPENLKGHVEFKNVRFSYSGKTDDNSVVLKDVSLEVVPGKITALVGLNRSGKTTCVKLLERFYQPQSGEILLDGKPLKDYKDQYLHEKMAVVSQDCVLFARSVRENIKYGCEGASDEDMYKAAKQASTILYCAPQVREALMMLAEDCSVLMISNKMSVAKTATHVVVLNNGTVEEEGSHDELMAKGGLYAEMVKKQEEGFKRPNDESNDEQ
uniref:Transporter 1, ATP-binding cassette, sub-family B (MDR/TAP) n=1 Tax=Fundulus heteroclitus TaxID=8078 RepID=A0A3Q2P4V1_FUNHE